MTPAEPDWDALAARISSLHAGETFRLATADARAGGVSNLNLVVTGSRGTRLVIRMPPEDGPLAPYDLGAESAFLAAAAANGVPTARTVDVDPGGDVCGTPYLVSEFVDGDVVMPGKDRTAADASAIADELIRVLDLVHRVPVSELSRSDGPVRTSTVDSLFERWAAPADHATYPVTPAFVEAWLRTHRPAETGPVLVHGDYRLGNMIWCDHAVVAVLDWECAAVGDPAFDLAWLLMGTSTDDDLVMGLITRRDFLARHASVTGHAVDRETLLWWEILVAWVRVSMELTGLRIARRSVPPDLRALLWEFGHAAAYRRMLDGVAALAGKV